MKDRIPKDKSFQYYDGSVWEGYSPKQMKYLYPQGGYSVAGEVLKKRGGDRSNFITSQKEERLYIQPPGTYPKPFYKSSVFLPYKDTFVVAKKRNLTFFLLSCATIMCVVMATVLIYSYWQNKPDIDPGASKYSAGLERPEEMDTSSILVPGYDDWSMQAETDKIYIALLNPEDNPCYFKFTVTLDEDKEVLFQTKLVPPGNAVKEVELPYILKQGIYPVTVTIESYSLNDPRQKLNGADVKTRIIAVK